MKQRVKVAGIAHTEDDFTNEGQTREWNMKFKSSMRYNALRKVLPKNQNIRNCANSAANATAAMDIVTAKMVADTGHHASYHAVP